MSIPVNHFDRTDVHWKPASQVQQSDRVFVQTARGMRVDTVIDVTIVDNFRVRLRTSSGTVHELYRSGAVAYTPEVPEVEVRP